MGFISFNLSFYRDELQKLETRDPAPSDIYRARQLVCMLDDLVYEGYTALNEKLEAEFRGVSRLHEYLSKNQAKPFGGSTAKRCDYTYSETETELYRAITQAVNRVAAADGSTAPAFINKLRRFCDRIGYDDGTTYIFLMRDTLLPFVYYLSQGRTRIFPWLLSRKSFAAITGKENADDEIRASVYRALEAGCTDFRSFSGFVLPEIKKRSAHIRTPKACSALSCRKSKRTGSQWSNRDAQAHFRCSL